MKVLLVNPQCKNCRDYSTLPLGVLSIATHLKNCGHTVKVLDRAICNSSIKATIEKFVPDIVGVSLLSAKAISDAKKISKYAHAKGIPVVYGNTLASAVPELLIKSGYADFVSIGEGEFTWEDLLVSLENNYPIENVLGLVFKKDGAIIHTCERPIANAADLPIIDWSFVKPSQYFRSGIDCNKMLYLYSAKGCNGCCSYCFNKTFHRCTYRKRPISDLLSEIRVLVDGYGMDGVFFADELWCANSKEARENCEAYNNSGIKFVWGCQIRIGMLTQEDYNYMYECGCRWIFFGVESGSNDLLKEMHKNGNINKTRETVRMVSKAGIEPICSFIFGLPGETSERLKDTVSLIKDIMPYSVYQTTYFLPIIGTDIYNRLAIAGKVKTPQKINDLKYWVFDSFSNNYSDVPTKELKVVRSYVTWWSLSGKHEVSDKSVFENHFVISVINVLKNLFQNGIVNIFSQIFTYAKIIFEMCFYLLCFPSIKKKYGLSLYYNGRTK